ncbi:MAG TPA: hypothetical protein VFK70_02565 [Vicinamibacteria bacterium]|nr:hypothetical protein [Vicinamibacteria bacterium]
MAIVDDDEERLSEGEPATAADQDRQRREREWDVFLSAMDGVFAAVLRPATRPDN